jgi:hypothetical protein
MKAISKSTNGPTLTVAIPDDWYFVDRPVPNLKIPHELFAVANRPLSLQRDPERSRPDLTGLGSDAIVLWAYYQAPNDPNWHPVDTLPDYSRYRMPFRYRDTEAVPSSQVREWTSDEFVWRRIGITHGNTWLTVWIWEGIHSGPDTTDRADAILQSMQLR